LANLSSPKTIGSSVKPPRSSQNTWRAAADEESDATGEAFVWCSLLDKVMTPTEVRDAKLYVRAPGL
jgi:hypothetical protein